MRDAVLITIESLRYDYREHCPVFEELETARAMTAGHYTRPALAGLLSGRYDCALDAAVDPPTLAGVLSRHGYTTIGVCHSPQTMPTLGFRDGFDTFCGTDPDSGPLARGSPLRERLAEFGPVRAIHRRLNPKGATLESTTADARAVRQALDAYTNADGPRFLWLHLMGSHRPYGRGDGALDARLDARAARTTDGLSDSDHETILEHYTHGLQRAGERAQRVLDAVADDAIVAVAGDHGEELGEQGYYFHGGYRRRVPNAITDVPLGVRGVEAVDGLAALPRALVEAIGEEPPAEWTADGRMTVAPWGEQASVAVETGSARLHFRDADVALTSAVDVSSNVEKQLAALGYRGVG